MTLSAALSTEESSKLDQLAGTTPTEQTQQAANQERVIDAFSVALAYAEQLCDPDYKRNVQEKLVRSNVRGSVVSGVKTPDDVVAMLSSVTGWREVNTNLKDPEITVLQGELPESTNALTAYASIREIEAYYGPEGLNSISARKGYQKDGEFYLCTMAKMPTNALTVQLKKDGSQVEHLHMWFAGVENSSRVRVDDGDVVVRCGSALQPKAAKGRIKDANGQGNRRHRAG